MKRFLFFRHDNPGVTRRWINREYVKNVLVPIGSIYEQFGPIRCPPNIIEVLCLLAFDDCFHRLSCCQFVNQNLDFWVWITSLGVTYGLQLGVALRIVNGQMVVSHVLLVDAIKC